MEKKILIIANNFTRGDSITACNIFSAFNTKNIYCASKFFDKTSSFRQYYRIGNKEIHYTFPFYFLSSCPKSIIFDKIVDNRDDAEGRTGLKWKIYKECVLKILQFLGIYDNRLSIRVSQEFRQWVDGIHPDVIFTSVGSLEMALFVRDMMQLYPNVKYIIQGYDDWMEPVYFTICRGRYRKQCDYIYQQILDKSSLRLASSEYMVEEYKKKYNADFIFFPNPVNVDLFNTVDPKTIEHSVLCIGNIGKHNLGAIVDMANAIDRYNMKNNDSLIFRIYGNYSKDVYSTLSQYECCAISSWVDHNQMPSIIKMSEILYLPISIDKAVERFTRFSMSTKIFEYLLSKRPLLYVGPDTIAMTRFLKKYACCYLGDNSNPIYLSNQIDHIVNDVAETKIITDKACNLAKQFDIKRVSNRLKELIMQL